LQVDQKLEVVIIKRGGIAGEGIVGETDWDINFENKGLPMAAVMVAVKMRSAILSTSIAGGVICSAVTLMSVWRRAAKLGSRAE
jgi:hypothetical protein